ncbi:hypothetical protein Y032_0011g1355 [Ancylostoma ceylanicum]|uniref:Uncharacterized protein n=1 Tax=Ancylostoma ceylanicum TaxID=53326 RepID=A0A016VE83_9BILA|nr:hypothetical protein Y032_0011g1355 [Ancylostoma ceylanicum]
MRTQLKQNCAYVQSTAHGRRRGVGPRAVNSGCLLHRSCRLARQRQGRKGENRNIVISRCLKRCCKQSEWAARGPAPCLQPFGAH